MPDTKISALTDGVTADSTDRVPVARSPFGAGDNRYVTFLAQDVRPFFTLRHLLSENYTIPAGTGAYIPRYHEIGAGFTLELGADADLEVG